MFKNIYLFIFIFLSFIFSFSSAIADIIDPNKEIDLQALSKKYPKCQNKNYRDECYDVSIDYHVSKEGYWKKNKLWDGVYTNTDNNIVEVKYFDGIKFPRCCFYLTSSGWYECSRGNKFKSFDGGIVSITGKREGKFIYKFKDGTVYEGNWENNRIHGNGKYTFANGDVYDGNWEQGKLVTLN